MIGKFGRGFGSRIAKKRSRSRKASRRNRSFMQCGTQLASERLEERVVLSADPVLSVVGTQTADEGAPLHISDLGAFTDVIESKTGAVGLNVANYSALASSTGEFDPSTNVVFNTDTLSFSGGELAGEGTTALANAGYGTFEIAVFAFSDFELDEGITVTAVGSRPLALLSQSNLRISGTIDVSATRTPNLPGPGGGAGGEGAAGNGVPAAGAPTTGSGTGAPSASGAGGGFGGAGGHGQSNGFPIINTGGVSYANLQAAIQGGSGGSAAGRAGNSVFARGGAGGGGVELAAAGLIEITTSGQVLANGAHGVGGVGTTGTGGGGGAGGGILIHGLSVTQNGFLSAIGGNGGSGQQIAGGGGGGQILIVHSENGSFIHGGTENVSGGTSGGSSPGPGKAGTIPGLVESYDYVIDWGDSSPQQTGSATIDVPGTGIGDIVSGSFDGSHTYQQDGDYTVTVTVNDSNGGSSTETFLVSVANVAPVLTPNAISLMVNEGETAVNDGDWSDVAADSVDLSADLGEVVKNGDGTWSWSHTTVDGDNAAFVTITAFDGTDSTSVTFSLEIKNVPPVLELSGAGTVAEGSPYTLALASSDVPADTIQYWTIDWGDGNVITYPDNPASVTHTYADGDANYVISATATDDDDTHDAGNTVEVAVLNVAPTLGISGATSIDAGDLFTLELSASDPGTDTISQWTIDWGDGSEPEVVTGNPSELTHVYAAGGGSYTISATATDEDGTYVPVEHVVAVEDVANETIYLLGGTLHVAAGELITDSEVTVAINGGSVEVTLNGETAAFDQADVEQIEIVLGSGNDVVTVGAGVTIPLVIDGGPGNDILAGGDGDDLLIGGAGTDILIGGAGDNVLLGGEGNDLLLGGTGNNVLSGGTGVDIIIGGSGRGLLIGGQGSDVLTGGSGDDILIGGSTIHDDDVDALDAIMAIWGSAQSFDSRVSALTGGGGLLQPNSAVSDDDALDIIISGAGRDLIFGDNNPFDGVFDLISLQASQDRLFAVT